MRYPVLGAALQRRGGTARHDAVAWGYARGARRAGRRHHPELRGHRHPPRRAAARSTAVETTRGLIGAQKIGVVAAGHTSVVMAMAGRAHAAGKLSAAGAGAASRSSRSFPCVVMSNTIHAYISQSDKGELVIGAGTDAYVSYTPARRAARHHAHAGRDLRAVPDVPAHADAAQLGRHRRRHARPLADHRQDRRCPACTSIAAGAPAASRRRPARPSVRPHHRARRAAPDQRAVHARTLPRRPA